MRDAIAWSYDLLDPPEQTVFRRLSVSLGGFDLAAADAVMADDSDEIETLDRVTSLVEKSILRQLSGPADGEPRLLMMETIRVRTAFSWTIEGGAVECGLRFARVMANYWTVHGYFRALPAAGWLARSQDDSESAESHLVEALEMSRARLIA